MINITTNIEDLLTAYAQVIPDLFLHYDRDEIQVVASNYCEIEHTSYFDIVLVISDEEELVLGEMVLSADFDLSYEIFAD